MRVTIILPVYNEIYTIKEILRRVRDVPLDKEILVVDDGSTDGTRRYLSGLNDPQVRVILHARNQGKGAAIRTGIREARGDCIAMQDADLEYNPAELPGLVGFLERDEADVVYGSRFLGTRRSFLFTHYLGNKVLNLITNVLYDSCLSDMETGYKIMRTELWRRLDLRGDRFEIEPEITAKVLRRGLRLVEVPITFVGRDYAAGKKIRWIDGVGAIWTLLRWRLAPLPREDGTLPVLVQERWYSEWMATWFADVVGQRVVELGAGLGAIARHFVDREAITLVDEDPRVLEQAARTFRHVDHVRCAKADITQDDTPAQLGPASFDTAIMVNVLEHIPDERRALANARKLLGPSGRLVLVVPAGQAAFGTLDQALGHVRRYERAALTRLVEEMGFCVERAAYHNRLGLLGWWVAGRILGLRRISSPILGAFHALLGVARALDRLWPADMGQSLLLVARPR